MAQVPATSYESTSLGDVAEFTIPFPFLSRAEVFVTVDGAPVAFTWINDGLVQLTAVPELGAIVRRYRSTEAYVPLHQFSQGVPFLPRYVDRDFKQTLYAVQESVNDTAGTAALALDTAELALDTAQDALTLVGERTQYMVLGAYGPGLHFQTTSQVFSYLGEFYAPGPSITLPYTTTGVGAAEIASFRSVGDAILRSDLVDDTDPTKGAALVGYKGRTTKAKLDDVVSVMDFGAVGDGVADDTSAIQSSIDYIKSVGGGAIEFPAGSYKVSAPLNIIGNFGFKGIELRGRRATITATHNGIAIFSKPAGISSPDAAPEYRQNTLIHGFVIQGPGKANLASVGVQIQQGANVQVRDCTIQGFYRGLHGVGALICNFDGLLIQDNQYGIDFIPTTPGGGYNPQFSPNDLHFKFCQLIDNTRAIRALSFPNGAVSFYGCEIEGNNLLGNTTDGARVVEFFDAGKVTFTACHFEDNPGEYNLFYHGQNSKCHLNLIGCEVIPGNTTGNCVYLSNASGDANAANAFIAGTRITNGVGNQLLISPGFKVVILGDIEGLVSGSLEKLTYMRSGRVALGTNESPSAQLKAVGDSATGIAIDVKGQTRIVDAAGARLAYLGNNGTFSYYLSDLGPLTLGTSGGQRVQVGRLGTATFEPDVDNSYSLGTASLRWGTVYAGTGTINTSDEMAKQQIQPIDSAAIRAWGKVKYTQYKFNDSVELKGGGARWHFGVIAQRVKEAFESEGLDPFLYGVLCYDEWPASQSEDPSTGVIVFKPAGSRYGIRYEEALALECAYLRERIECLAGRQ